MENGWIDIIGTVDQAAAAAALTYEAVNDTPFMRYWTRHDQTDALTLTYQMPHGWDKGYVEPHIHWLCGSNVSGDVSLTVYYCWTGYLTGLAVPALASLPTFTGVYTIPANLLWQEHIVSLGAITPPAAAKKPSSDLMVFIRRNGTSPADTYNGSKPGGSGTAAANLGLQFADCHVRVDRLGTEGIYA